jgi:hypothetical protein
MMENSDSPSGSPKAATELAIVFPIPAGSTRRAEALAAELQGPRWEEFCRSQRALRIRKERWFLNDTSQGSSVTVYLEAEDVAQALGKLVVSQDATDLWLKEQVKGLTGVDFNRAPRLPVPKPLLRYPR